MARPAGYSSEEDDELDRFLDKDEPVAFADEPAKEPTKEEKLQTLLYCIMTGNLNEVLSIINQGIDINETLPGNWSPLLLAASTGNAEIAKKLLEMGADVNFEKDKYTVLMAACNCPESTSLFENCLEIVEEVIKRGVDVNEITKKRMTAFMYAARTGNVLILEKLLPICDPKLKDNQGWTALFHAVNSNKPEAVKFLLDQGLSADMVDVRGNLPLFYAVSQSFEEVANLLPKKEETKALCINNSYSFDDMYNEIELCKRPKFVNEVLTLLHGMKCEQLSDLFINANVDLLTFLQMDNKQLKEIHIEIPYQRKRILYGLHKFHQHPYKPTSLPIFPKKPSTIDVRLAIVTAIRHLITMKAAIHYLNKNYMITSENSTVIKGVTALRSNLRGFSRTVGILTKKVKEWDNSQTNVDQLPVRNETTNFMWIVLIASIGVMGCAIVGKLR